MIYVNSRAEYDYCVSRGYDPLIDWRMFTMHKWLRIDIQHELFGAGNFHLENQKFYKWVWEHSLHNCHDRGKQLYDYSSVYVSHIISRGSDRRMACDPRNVNMLSYEAHMNWEDPVKRKKMNVYRINKLIIDILKYDYNI